MILDDEDFPQGQQHWVTLTFDLAFRSAIR